MAPRTGRRRQDIADREKADAAMDAVVQELAQNRDAVHASIDYHATVLDSLHAFRAEHPDPNDKAVPSIALFRQGFINPPQTPSHAWDASTYSGTLELIPFERIVMASRLYQDQQRYQQSVVQVSGEIYRTLFSEGAPGMLRNWRNLSGILSSMVFRECELARNYEEVLPQLDSGVEALPEPQYCTLLPKR